MNILPDGMSDCNNDYEMEKLKGKIKKMSTVINKLSKENAKLKANMNNMEVTLERVCNHLGLHMNKMISTSTHNLMKDNIEEEETWLYCIKIGTEKEKIMSALGVQEIESTVYIEITANSLIDERRMYVSLLQNYKNFAEFADDWESMSLKELSHYFQSILSANLVNETVIVIRNIPNKKDKLYEGFMTQIAILAGIMFKCWNELTTNKELVGKMALVLESEDELQIVNIKNNDIRLILYVDSLI